MVEYLDLSYLKNKLVNILTNARNEMTDDENKNIVESNFDDDYIDEYADCMVYEFNADMKKYLHQNSTRIDGNLNNVNYDYNNHRNGEVKINYPLLNDLKNRLDNNAQDPQTKSDRHWLVDWFFDTFGSWGIKYNFQETISETCYIELEQAN